MMKKSKLLCIILIAMMPLAMTAQKLNYFKLDEHHQILKWDFDKHPRAIELQKRCEDKVCTEKLLKSYAISTVVKEPGFYRLKVWRMNGTFFTTPYVLVPHKVKDE